MVKKWHLTNNVYISKWQKVDACNKIFNCISKYAMLFVVVVVVVDGGVFFLICAFKIWKEAIKALNYVPMKAIKWSYFTLNFKKWPKQYSNGIEDKIYTNSLCIKKNNEEKIIMTLTKTFDFYWIKYILSI
jgi:hypothetical protein